MSAKFTVLCLDGKSRSRTRVRIERLVADGTVEKLGPRTYRETRPAYAPHIAVMTTEQMAARISSDTSLDGGALLSWLGVHYLPYNFPIPLSQAERYARMRA